jgi:hypothetical protein
MNDPLSIPDEKRADGRISLFDAPERSWLKRWWLIWVLGVVAVVLNGWFDYHHPLGLLFDILIVVILAVRFGIRSRN